MPEQTAPKHKLRIILSSNAPFTTSGYATQVEQIAWRIKRAGYEIALVNFYGQEGGKFVLNDIMMYPRMFSVWGEDALLEHGREFKADISMTLQDIWTLNPDILRQLNRFVPILPVDHEPPPPSVLEKARFAYRIISYSKFGQKQLSKFGMYSTYIPHTVDTNVLKPEDKIESRKSIGIPPDMFLFGMVAANKDHPSRKCFQETIDAFAEFLKTHPNSGMYFHTLIAQQGGFPIEQYWNFLGLPKNRVFWLKPYDLLYRVDRSAMAKVYNSMDCLLAPSTNEGFGVPIIEAQSCGVPVITNNFTAMPELIIPGKTGFLTEVMWKRFDGLGSYVAHPSSNSIHNCMVDIYKANRQKMGETARQFIVDNYDSEKVFNEKWLPFLDRLEKEIYPPSVAPKE